MFSIILIIVLIVYISIVDYLNKIRVKKRFQLSGVNGPKFTLPLIGDVLLGVRINVTNLPEHFKRWQHKYGKVCHMWHLNKSTIVVQDVEYAKMILGSNTLLKKPYLYDQLIQWLGNGILLSIGSKYKNTRRIILQSFTLKMLEHFVKVFNQHANILIEKIQPLANGSTIIDIHPVLCSTTLDIIVETAMGVKISADNPESLAYLKAFKSVMHLTNERFVKFTQIYDLLYMIMSYKSYRTLRKDIQILQLFREKIINKRREEIFTPLTNNNKENVCPDMDIKNPQTFLDILLQSTIDGQYLSNKTVQEEIDNIIFGGHDTTGTAMSFILYTLARHPKEQHKVFEEITSIIGVDKNKPITMEELQKMKYLDCVIKESLRLYPPGPIIGRVTEKDYIDGVKEIPNNTNILILIYAICRDPDYFPTPNEFIPERFINEKQNPYAFLPFSAGPRSCPGQRFAMLKMKTIISYILRNYELLPLGPEVNPTVIFILHSTTGVNLGLKPRIY